MNFKNILYAISCMSFTVILGAAIYEHIAVWPKAFAAAPRSLSMFQGQYGLDSAPFWKSIHPVTLLLLITSLAFHWKTERRKQVLITLSGYVLILISTFAWFVPTLMSIIKMPYADVVNGDVTRLGELWISLSLVRAIMLFVLSLVLFLGLTKSGAVLQRRKEVSPAVKGSRSLVFAESK
jgi:hypothetical protein